MGKAVGNIVGSITGANAARDAANAAAAQQREAAQTAAYNAAFRPVGMTTRFGTSQFTREIDPRTGLPFISSAGYTAAPELQALQGRLFGGFEQGLTQAEQMGQMYAPLAPAAQGLFNLGQQYIAQSPQQARQEFMQQQQALLAPQREQQLAGIRNRLFTTGRGGLATGGTVAGARGASNPELQAYYNALAQQDLALAAGAEQAAQQRATYGAGLFGAGAGLVGTGIQGQAAAYSPFTTQLGLASQIEQMAQQPYQLGLSLGSAQMPGQTAGSQMFQSGMNAAAQTQAQGAAQAAAINSAFLSNLLGSAAGGMAGGGAGAAGGGMFSSLGNMFGNPMTALRYGTNLGSQQTRMLAAQDF